MLALAGSAVDIPSQTLKPLQYDYRNVTIVNVYPKTTSYEILGCADSNSTGVWLVTPWLSIPSSTCTGTIAVGGSFLLQLSFLASERVGTGTFQYPIEIKGWHDALKAKGNTWTVRAHLTVVADTLRANETSIAARPD